MVDRACLALVVVLATKVAWKGTPWWVEVASATLYRRLYDLEEAGAWEMRRSAEFESADLTRWAREIGEAARERLAEAAEDLD
jgi:hypothetical protein